MIELIIISLAAALKAFADTLDHHFDTSIFRWWSRKYFDPNVINKTGPKIFGYPLDGWHIANSLQILCWFIVALVYSPTFMWYGDLACGGIVFIVVFNVLYNEVFR